MLIIRRRLPSGQRRIIPLGGANFFSSIRCQAESLARPRGDAVAQLAALTGTRADFYATAETSGQFIADILSALEATRIFRVDASPAVENQHNTAISGDGRTGIESVTQPVFDFILRQEYGSRVATDYILPSEDVNTLQRTDAFAAVEAQRSARVDFSGQTEITGTAQIIGDGILNLENTTTPRGDGLAYAESVLMFRPVGAAANAESIRAVAVDVFPRIENLGQAVMTADALVKIESGFSIFSDSANQLANLLGFRSDSTETAESVAAIATTSAVGDARGALEYLSRVQRAGYFSQAENLGLLQVIIHIGSESEVLVTDRVDFVGQIENTTTIFASRRGLIETVALVIPRDVFGAFELLHTNLGDARAWVETLGQLIARGDAAAAAEIIATARRDALAATETTLRVLLDSPDLTEYGLSVRADGAALTQVTGQVILRGDGQVTIELLAGPQNDSALAAESLALVQIDAAAATSQVVTRRSDSVALTETIAGVVTDPAANIEAQTQRRISSDLIGRVEIAGQQVTFPQLFSIIMEIGQGAGSIPGPGYPLAWVSLVGTGIDPAGDNTIQTEWGPFLVLNKAHTAISSGRVRLITVPYTAPQVQARPFDPLAALTQDTFGFDLTADAGGATIVSNTWTATFDPGSTQAYDDAPNARILTTWSPTTIYETNPLDNTVQAINGTYACAFIGTCPASAVGGAYTVVAHIALSDTRQWLISSSFLCTQTT